MVVNANMKTNKANMMVKGMAIFKDLDRKIYIIIPAMKQAIAVRVPEMNIAHAQPIPTTRKKILYLRTFAVIPKIIKATAVEAIPIPKLAASL